MIKVDEKEIVKGKGPVSGVILTREEYDDLCAKDEEYKRRANEAVAANQEAEDQLEALRKVKKEKEIFLTKLKKKYDEREEEFERLDIEIEHRQRLNHSLSAHKEDAR